MNDVSVPLFTIKNINDIDYDSFDTLILGHLDKMTTAIKNEEFVTKLISTTLQHKKKIFSFDDLSKYGFSEPNDIYFPTITYHNVPPTGSVCSIKLRRPLLAFSEQVQSSASLHFNLHSEKHC